MVLSNLLKETLKAGKTVLKAPKRKHSYFPMQNVKEPDLMRVLEGIVTN
jgi:hypothetical protein